MSGVGADAAATHDFILGDPVPVHDEKLKREIFEVLRVLRRKVETERLVVDGRQRSFLHMRLLLRHLLSVVQHVGLHVRV